MSDSDKRSKREPDPALNGAEEEEDSDYMELPDVIGAEDGDFVTRVDGFGMDRAGILRGDYVVVRPTKDPGDGAMVVASIAGDREVLGVFEVDRQSADQMHLVSRRGRSRAESHAVVEDSDDRFFGLIIGIVRAIPPPSEGQA